MQAIEAGEVEWTAYVEGNIEFHQPDAIRTETKLIRDVLEAGEVKRLKEFILTFNKLNMKYGVDLETGEFIIGGLKHDLAPDIPKCNLRLIYYIRKRGEKGAYDPNIPVVYVHRYLVGWQTTCDGRNFQRILFIDPNTGKFELHSKR